MMFQKGDEVVCIYSGEWANSRREPQPGPVIGEICIVAGMHHDTRWKEQWYVSLQGYNMGSNMKPITYKASFFRKVVRKKSSVQEKIAEPVN